MHGSVNLVRLCHPSFTIAVNDVRMNLKVSRALPSQVLKELPGRQLKCHQLSHKQGAPA